MTTRTTGTPDGAAPSTQPGGERALLTVYAQPDGALTVDVFFTFTHDPDGERRRALTLAVAETVTRGFSGADSVPEFRRLNRRPTSVQ